MQYFFERFKVQQALLPDTDEVARFVYSKHHIKKGKVVAEAFSPDPCFPYELSVYKSTGLAKEALWPLAIPRGESQVKAYAQLKVADVHNLKFTSKFLQVLSYPFPHPLHANIHNLPSAKKRETDTNEQTAKKNAFKLQLANLSLSVLKQQ